MVWFDAIPFLCMPDQQINGHVPLLRHDSSGGEFGLRLEKAYETPNITAKHARSPVGKTR